MEARFCVADLGTSSRSFQGVVRPGTFLTNFLFQLRDMVLPSRPVARFRDPWLDFGVTATPDEALEPAPEVRHQPGAYIAEHGDYLSLYLGGSTAEGVHSIMDCKAPSALVLSYTQTMAGFARFCPDPRSIGMLGLGGGSLAKHCFHAFPRARITVAEIDPNVIALRRRFLIPEEDQRVTVLQADGARMVEASPGRFDVLLVDAFDEGGHLNHLGTRAFYRNCYRALTTSGVLVLNFSAEAWRDALPALDRVFAGQVVFYRCPDGDNVIAFATSSRLPDLS